ncbi:MAG: hypothetical protein KJN63_08945, partial [Acidimicrobiia bacterium]|nr:hypothetical protein [Acidimicrobiia bacterium]
MLLVDALGCHSPAVPVAGEFEAGWWSTLRLERMRFGHGVARSRGRSGDHRYAGDPGHCPPPRTRDGQLAETNARHTPHWITGVWPAVSASADQ